MREARSDDCLSDFKSKSFPSRHFRSKAPGNEDQRSNCYSIACVLAFVCRGSQRARCVPTRKSLRGQLETKHSPSLKTPNSLVSCFRARVDIPAFNLLATYSCAGFECSKHVAFGRWSRDVCFLARQVLPCVASAAARISGALNCNSTRASHR
jgi:hypothetical protein